MWPRPWFSTILKDEQKLFHNRKSLVPKVLKKYKIIDAHMKNTHKKYLLKLVESQKKKVLQFVLKLRHTKSRNFETAYFSFVGLSDFPQKELIEVEFKTKACFSY